MAQTERYVPRLSYAAASLTPFADAEEAWFWFIQSHQARIDGARFTAGQGLAVRPCEPIDILKTVDRLYRQRLLQRDHLLVLRHYGRRLMPPDPRRLKEIRAYKIWREALQRLETSLIGKGIVRPRPASFASAQNLFAKHFSAMEVAAL